MCKCTPNIRTPYCGKMGCEWPREDNRILEIKKRRSLISEGKWETRVDTDYYQAGVYIGHSPYEYVLCPETRKVIEVPCKADKADGFSVDICRVEGTEYDEDFLLNAPSDIDYLLAENERLKKLFDR